MPLKRHSSSMRYSFNDVKTFYIEVKTIERVKKKTMFQRKTTDFEDK